MKVRCLANQATSEQAQKYGLDPRVDHRFDVTPDRTYTVIGLTMMVKSWSSGAGVALDLLDDFSRWSIQPLFLFEVIDPRPSRYWVAKKLGEAELALWPESFFQDFYHDHLTDGVPEVVADFKRVCGLLEAEYAEAADPQEWVPASGR